MSSLYIYIWWVAMDFSEQEVRMTLVDSSQVYASQRWRARMWTTCKQLFKFIRLSKSLMLFNKYDLDKDDHPLYWTVFRRQTPWKYQYSPLSQAPHLSRHNGLPPGSTNTNFKVHTTILITLLRFQFAYHQRIVHHNDPTTCARSNTSGLSTAARTSIYSETASPV